MGLVNKYRQISVFKMFIAGVLMIITIGLINVVRAGFQEDSMKSDLALKSMAVLYIYEANYVPIVKKVDKGSMELQYGNEYLQSAILFVPRFLYPEKPVSFDYFLKEKLGRTFKGGGLPPTPVGSLFLNFGFPGVIMGMLTIGFLYNMLFSMYRRESYSKAVISLYLMYYIMNPSQFFGNLSLLAIFVIFIFLTSTIMRQSVGSGSAAVPGAGEPAR
jgi:hypothetical protein